MQGKETSDPDSGRQCPFFDEMHAVFIERAKNMQRLLTQPEKRGKTLSGNRYSDELSDDEDDVDEEDENEAEVPVRGNSRKRKIERTVSDKTSRGGSSGGKIEELLKDFFEKQQRMEIEWMEMMERRARERELLEQEWRQRIEKHEREMLMVEQAWREKEEQRKIKEERRAETRDALLTTLLTKLINENNL